MACQLLLNFFRGEKLSPDSMLVEGSVVAYRNLLAIDVQRLELVSAHRLEDPRRA